MSGRATIIRMCHSFPTRLATLPMQIRDYPYHLHAAFFTSYTFVRKKTPKGTFVCSRTQDANQKLEISRSLSYGNL
jgi:hypothetical protein